MSSTAPLNLGRSQNGVLGNGLHPAVQQFVKHKSNRNYPCFPGVFINSRRIPDSFKLKEIAEDNFKFDKNGGKPSGRVENAVGKGQIAIYEQILLFPKSIQKTCKADM